MNIELERIPRMEINSKDQSAKVIKSLDVTGNVYISRYILNEGQKFKIITIGRYSLSNAEFYSLTFPIDS